MSTNDADLSILEVRFWGRVTAGLGHELNNVLAIVDGHAGLQEDLLSLGGGCEKHAGRLGDAAEGIGTQVRRGKELTTLLRSLAHSADAELEPLDVDRRLGEAIQLCRRFAGFGSVELHRRDGDRTISVAGRAFDLLHVICRCLLPVLAAAEKGGTVTLGAEPVQDGVRIVAACDFGLWRSPEFEEELAFLSRLADHLGGAVVVHGEEGSPLQLILDLPSTLGAGILGTGALPRNG